MFLIFLYQKHKKDFFSETPGILYKSRMRAILLREEMNRNPGRAVSCAERAVSESETIQFVSVTEEVKCVLDVLQRLKLRKGVSA